MARFNTEQEVVDHVASFLKKQGKRAGCLDHKSSKYRCKYITDDGLMCAIGACFEDPSVLRGYTYSISCLIDECPDLYTATFGPTISFPFLARIQTIHDSAENDDTFWEDVKRGLQMICFEYELTPPLEIRES